MVRHARAGWAAINACADCRGLLGTGCLRGAPRRPENETFDFLGFTFRPRMVRDRQGRFFVGFTPAFSSAAAKEICQTMGRWKLDRQSVRSLDELAAWCNPMLRGWINYYGRFRHSALYQVFHYLDEALARWARAKYKRLKTRRLKSQHWLREIAVGQPQLFAHWQLGRKLMTAE